MAGVIAPGDDIVQAAGEHVEGEQPEQQGRPYPGLLKEGDLQDAVSAEQAIKNKKQYMHASFG